MSLHRHGETWRGPRLAHDLLARLPPRLLTHNHIGDRKPSGRHAAYRRTRAMQSLRRQRLALKQAPHPNLRRPRQHTDKRLAPVARAPLGLMPAGLAPLRSHCHTQRRGQPTNWSARRPHGGIRTCLAHRRQQGRSPTVIVLPLPCRPRRLSHGHPRPRRQSRQGSYSRADWRLLPIDQHRPSPRLRRPSRNQQRPAPR